MRGRKFLQRTAMVVLIASTAGCADEGVGRDALDTVGLGMTVSDTKPARDKPSEPDAGVSASDRVQLFVKVVNTDEQPIPDATVRIVERAARTDSQGQVLLDNLVPGETMIQVYHPQYARIVMNTTLDFVHAAAKIKLPKRSLLGSFDQSQTNSVKHGAYEVTITPGSLVDPLGCTNGDPVNVYITQFDVQKDLQWLSNPPIVADEGTKIPHPIVIAQLVSIEIERGIGDKAMPLSLKSGASMQITMPLDPIDQKTDGISVFGQDKSSGRWEQSAEPIKAISKNGIWTGTFDVHHLGLLSAGWRMMATKTLTATVNTTDGEPAQFRSVLVRAAGSRSAATGFTNRDGNVELLVPMNESILPEIPAFLNTGMEPKSTLDEVGWRCGTTGQGVCALGRVLPDHTCKSIFDEAALKAKNEEYCNGIDDDCDGVVDEIDALKDVNLPCPDNQDGLMFCNEYGALICKPKEPNKVCFAGQTESCYSGPTGTLGIGICKSGLSTCSSDGSAWGPCNGEVGPGEETCNGLDDDCDGTVDDWNPGGGLPCSTGLPGVCANGTTSCANGEIVCNQNVQSSAETCNGLDDDCDGAIDENNPGSGLACNTGKAGVCSIGTTTCTADGIVCNQNVQPSTETCNNQDDDCNGAIDDNFGTISCGIGRCMTTVPKCSFGTIPTCTPKAPTPELCNGEDDDCDGDVDNGNPESGATCDTGQPGVCANGTTSCANGAIVCNQNVQPGTEVCNGKDDNCDGQVDENPLCAHACLARCTNGAPDGYCDTNENSFTCAQDCAYGDGMCSGSETPQSSFVDCNFSNDANGMCGNGYCESWEVDIATKTLLCPQDCWNGVVIPNFPCGDGNCSDVEDSSTCAADCGNLTQSGNGSCDPGEHWATTPDCDFKLDAGTFIEAHCTNNYALVETYADGLGGTTEHVVNACSESCGAAPWKMIAPNPNDNTFEGVQVLRPDCSICTLTNAPTAKIVGDVNLGYGWLNVYSPSTYDMDVDPNDCHMAAYSYWDNYHGLPAYLTPVEWEKVGEKDCTQAACTVLNCDGNPHPKTGIVGTWKPAYGSWAKYESICK